MSSQRRKEKKRVTHIGKRSTEKSRTIEEGLAEFLEDMSSTIDVSEKALLEKQQNIFLNKRKQVEEATPSTSNQLHGKQKKIALVRPDKKFLPEKKHPLMAKCQRNIQYIKHNRSVPKQRAHVGTLPDFPRQSDLKSHINERILKKGKTVKRKKIIFDSDEFENSPKRFLNAEKDDSSVSDEFQPSDFSFKKTKKASSMNEVESEADKSLENSSDSDRFETFLNFHKRLTDSDGSGSDLSASIKVKKKHKKKKDKIKKKHKKNDIKSTKKGKKKVDGEGLVKHKPDEHNSVKWLEETDINSMSSSAFETNLISGSENESSISLQEPFLSNSLDGALAKPYAAPQLKDCSVKIKRIPTLDAIFNQCNSTIINSCKGQRDGIKLDALSNSENSVSPIDFSENKSDSEDECTFLGEVKKSADSLSSESNCSSHLKDPQNTFAAVLPSMPSLDDKNSNFIINSDQEMLNEKNNIEEVSNSDFKIQILSVCSLDEQFDKMPNDNKQDVPFALTGRHVYNIDPAFSASESASPGISRKALDEIDPQILQTSALLNIPFQFPQKSQDLESDNDSFIREKENNLKPVSANTHPQSSSQNSTVLDNSKLNELLSKIDIKYIDEVTKQCSSSANEYINNAKGIFPKYELITQNAKNSFDLYNQFVSSNSDISNLALQNHDGVNSILNNSSTESFDCGVNKIDLNQCAALREKNVFDDCTLPNFHVSGPSQESPTSLSKILSNNPLREDSHSLLKSEQFWQNLKDALESTNLPQNPNLKNSSKKSLETTDIPNEPVLENISNTDHLVKLAVQDLRKSTDSSGILLYASNVDRLNTNIAIKEENYTETAADELDVITVQSIQDLYTQNEETVLPLFGLYANELKQYNKIKSTEINVSAGLKMLEETQAHKIKYIETAIHHLVKHDPSFYYKGTHRQKAEQKWNCDLHINKDHEQITSVSTQEPVEKAISDILLQEKVFNKATTQVEREELNHKRSKQVLNCDNCGNIAKLQCRGCDKVFYCSEECGINYWKKGHSSNCR